MSELTYTRVFDAPKALVFRCMIEPEHLTHFWGPAGVSTPLETIKVDARPGGIFEGYVGERQAGGRCPHDIRRRHQHVADQHIDRRIVEPQHREQLEQRDAGDQRRKHQRRQQDRGGGAAAGKLMTGDGERGWHAEQQGPPSGADRQRRAEPE